MLGKENLSYCDVVGKGVMDFLDISDARKNYYDFKCKGRQSNAKRYVDSFAASMFDNQQKIDAFLIFSKETSYGEFCDKVKQSMLRQIRNNWEEISPGFLSYVTAEYAYSKEDLKGAGEGEEKDFLIAKKEFTASILGAYFNGPETIHGRVQVLYNFALAALDNLVDDKTAMAQAANILAFEESEILPRKSKVFQDWVVASFYMYYDDTLIQKALIFTEVESMLCQIAGLNTEEIKRHNNESIRGDHDDAKTIEKRRARALRINEERLGTSEASKRARAILDLFMKEETMFSSPLCRADNSWPYNLISDKRDPLLKKFLEVLENNLI